MLEVDDNFYYNALLHFNRKRNRNKAILTLRGILTGMCFDGEVSKVELEELKTWLSVNVLLIQKPPFSGPIAELMGIVDKPTTLFTESEELNAVACKLDSLLDDEALSNANPDIIVLEGICHGILADDYVVTQTECDSFLKWLNDRAESLSGTFPSEEIKELLENFQADSDSQGVLRAFLSQFVDFGSSNLSDEKFSELQRKYTTIGIYEHNPSIKFKDKLFCFTGQSRYGKRSDFADFIEQMGGRYKDTVVLGTDYLVVGGLGNPSWMYSSYGSKVERAIENKKNGHSISIIHENDFIRFLENMDDSTQEIGSVNVEQANENEDEDLENAAFGCCHLYRECSNAKRCLQDEARSANCAYRKNLEAGKIFYGKNVNGFSEGRLNEYINRIEALPAEARRAFDDLLIDCCWARRSRKIVIRNRFITEIESVGLFKIKPADSYILECCSYRTLEARLIAIDEKTKGKWRNSSDDVGTGMKKRRLKKWVAGEGAAIFKRISEPYRLAVIDDDDDLMYLEEIFVDKYFNSIDSSRKWMSPLVEDGVLPKK